MPDKTPDSPTRPADIAREALRRLALSRIAPTPDNYRRMYEEIAGIAAPETGDAAKPAAVAAQSKPQSEPQSEPKSAPPVAPELTLTESLPAVEAKPAVPVASAKEKISLVDDAPPAAPLKSAGMSLVDDAAPPRPKSASVPLVDPAPAGDHKTTPSTAVVAATVPGLSRRDDSLQVKAMRDMLARTLGSGVGILVQESPELSAEIKSLVEQVREAYSEPSLQDTAARLKQLIFKLELRSADAAEERELLLRLFNLLLENVGELLEDDSWLHGQIESVQQLLAGPLTHHALLDATRSLKEVIYKQGLLKHSLAEAKTNVKTMMITFIDRLGAVATSTGDFHQRMGSYADKISKARGMGELSMLVDDVMRDTRSLQTEALRSRDDMLAARAEVQQAESRIQELEAKLAEMSELVREDALTGSLNRRGLDDVLEREIARSERRNSPLCVALLDLDDFKRLNDTYGHAAGDGALVHLVGVVRDTLRTMDMIARFGGEEFLIVLPDTPLDDAAQVVTRVQRELTKRIFLHNHDRVLITFSAGVALRQSGEEQSALIQRADAALYQAKRAGKNRVVKA